MNVKKVMFNGLKIVSCQMREGAFLFKGIDDPNLVKPYLFISKNEFTNENDPITIGYHYKILAHMKQDAKGNLYFYVENITKELIQKKVKKKKIAETDLNNAKKIDDAFEELIKKRYKIFNAIEPVDSVNNNPDFMGYILAEEYFKKGD